MESKGIYMSLESVKGRNRVIDINMAAKFIFKKYAVVNNICIALNDDYLEHKILHRDSVVIIKDTVPEYPILDMVELDSAVFNKALRNRCKNYQFKDNELLMSKGKEPEVYTVGAKITGETVETKFIKTRAFKSYLTYAKLDKNCLQEWCMDSQTRLDLIGHQTPNLTIGFTKKGEPIRLKSHHRIFPAIKKTEDIRIYTKPSDIDDNLYEIYIVSETDNWRMITHHVIVNF